VLVAVHLAAAANMNNELATLANTIKEREEEERELKGAIKTGDEAALKALGYDSREEAKAALKEIRKLLILDKEDKARLQEQSDAGTFDAAVGQENVIPVRERSCCVH
jgi:Holliday junction resolvasome RuvABC DNA-binding subunit